MVKLRGKIIIAVVVAASIAISARAIIKEYRIEKELKASKAEELEKSPAEVVQIRTMDGNLLKDEEPIVTAAAVVKTEKIAPVQVEEPEPEETFKPHEEIPLAEEYQEWIESECDRLGVCTAYAYALIESESSFRTGILVEDGAGHSVGLCQINSVNWPDMEANDLDPYDTFDNITYCLMLVSKYINKYADAEDLINTVTTCYKAGEAGAKKLNYHLSSCEHIKERMAYYSTILYGKE